MDETSRETHHCISNQNQQIFNQDTTVDLAKHVLPHTLTILTTYQCTAACEQCCFESSPQVTGGLTREQIVDFISEAKQSFPSLKLVVFSGGEAFLLKDRLYAVIEAATSHGLLTRVVTNGSWGKNPEHAFRTAEKLRLSGITEINISTGLDHQKWVPVDSVVNAAHALVKTGIPTLVTIESETEYSRSMEIFVSHPMIRDGLATNLLRVQSNSWMPFHAEAERRVNYSSLDTLSSGCSQIFETIVITPHGNLSACCGLTLEHIPEMRLGHLHEDGSMRDLYLSQCDDFLKYWIHVDGPYRIIERLAIKDGRDLLKDVVHICQACAVLHQSQEVRRILSVRYAEFVPEIMTRFVLGASLKSRELGLLPSCHAGIDGKEEV